MKGKSRQKRKKKRSRLLWIGIAAIGMTMATAAICVVGMLTKRNDWKLPEELLVEYMGHVPRKEYEQMYAVGSIGTEYLSGRD